VNDVALERVGESTRGRKGERENPDGDDFLMRRPHIFHQ
jgi:hypothetical protein